ncbi:MAG: ornithine cyclodeaminase family protein [Gemmatimonadaceae bacterium]|nr:ornithine cyclodeaminase family protein [Gemmatimonadaceae bacterium]
MSNDTLIVSHADVVRLLPMSACIDVMADALAATTRGDALLPLRQMLRVGGPNLFAVMPAVLGGQKTPASIGAKIITVFPGNDATPYESHIGVVLYFDNEHGRLLAVIDASSVTAIRTAAVSGLATRLLSNPGASRLAILGAGVQAMTHLEAMLAVRPITDVRIWSRTQAKCEAFARWAKQTFGIAVQTCATAEAAVHGAEIVCTVTASREPVLRGAWLAPGVHINAVGAAQASARELDTDVVQHSRLYVDRRESALNEAGDFLLPRAEGAIDDTHIVAELGEVVVDATRGRVHAAERTIFKSLGLAVEDVAAAKSIYERAVADGSGTWITLGGMRV